MNRILKSLILLGALSMFAFEVTKAAWSDAAQSTANIFTAGTLDLKLSDTDETDADAVSMTWGDSGMVPGGTPVDATLTLKNSGTVVGDHVHFSVANTITDNGAAATPDMDSYLEISTLEYDGGNIFGQIADANGNGYIDLSDFAAAGTIGDNTSATGNALTDLGVNHTLRMVVGLEANAPSEIQGDSVETTLTATLHQSNGQ